MLRLMDTAAAAAAVAKEDAPRVAAAPATAAALSEPKTKHFTLPAAAECVHTRCSGSC